MVSPGAPSALSMAMLWIQCSGCLPQVRGSWVVKGGLREGSFEVIVWNWCRIWKHQRSGGCESKLHLLGPVRAYGCSGCGRQEPRSGSRALSPGLGQRAGAPDPGCGAVGDLDGLLLRSHPSLFNKVWLLRLEWGVICLYLIRTWPVWYQYGWWQGSSLRVGLIRLILQ